jgi:cytochrome c peroxidase
MKNIFLVMIFSAIFANIAYANSKVKLNESELQGKEFYDEANCKSCHDDYVFEKDTHKMKNKKELTTRVKRCAVSYADWFEEDTLQVIEYLNTRFYHYK